MGAFKPIWTPVDSGESIIEAFGGLDLDYINERYRIYDPALGRLVEKPWTAIVNNRSVPAGRTYWDSNGVLQTAAADAPVIEYDPATGEKLGNRIWGSYTNQYRNSSNPLGSAWNRVFTNVTDLGGGVFGLAPSSSANNSYIGQGQAFSLYPDNAVVTLYYDVKADDFSYFRIQGKTKANTYPNAVFDLVNGAVTSGTNFGKIKPLSGGYFRCSLTWNIGTGADASFVTFSGPTDGPTGGLTVPSADGIKKVLMKRCQLEAAAAPSPYILTVDSPVTVSTEAQIIIGQNFLDLWNDNAGTSIVFASSANALGYLVQADNGTGFHRRLMRFDGGGGVRAFSIQNSAIGSASVGTVYVENALKKAAVVHNRGGTNLVAADGAVASFGDATPEVPVRLRIGTDGSSASTINGHIRRSIVLRKALPNSLLQRITQV